MIGSLRIQGFRCFSDFRMEGLGRVNLLVGRNNSGKTALLEALELLASSRKGVWRLGSMLDRRGEAFPENVEGPAGQRQVEYDVSHLFTGHRFRVGSAFEIEAVRTEATSRVRCEIALPEPASKLPYREEDVERALDASGGAAICLKSSDCPEPVMVPLTARGGLTPLAVPRGAPGPSEQARAEPTLVPTGSLSVARVEDYWKDVALNRMALR